MIPFLSWCSTTLTTIFLVQLLLPPPLISATTDITDTPVLDMDGNPLDFTSQYYIIAATPRRFPSGLRLKLRPDSQTFLSCPEFVYRTRFEHDFGLPVKFLSTDPSETTITPVTDLQISFVSAHLYCPPIWGLTAYPENGRSFVSTGVPVNRNWNDTQGTMLNALFKIVPITEDQPYVYKITYSPPPTQLALDVGELALFTEDDYSWLGLSFDTLPGPLPVFFKKFH